MHSCFVTLSPSHPFPLRKYRPISILRLHFVFYPCLHGSSAHKTKMVFSARAALRIAFIPELLCFEYVSPSITYPVRLKHIPSYLQPASNQPPIPHSHSGMVSSTLNYWGPVLVNRLQSLAHSTWKHCFDWTFTKPCEDWLENSPTGGRTSTGSSDGHASPQLPPCRLLRTALNSAAPNACLAGSTPRGCMLHCTVTNNVVLLTPTPHYPFSCSREPRSRCTG